MNYCNYFAALDVYVASHLEGTHHICVLLIMVERITIVLVSVWND